MQQINDFIDIEDKVNSAFEEEQKGLIERYQNAPFGEAFLAKQIERLADSRNHETTYAKVSYKEFSLTSYYAMGWEGAEHDNYHDVPKGLYKWDKQVLADIEKKFDGEPNAELLDGISKAAIDEYIRGAADGLIYFWLKREQKKLSIASENETVLSGRREQMLKWNGGVSVLYTLFGDLLEKKYITWNGKGKQGEKEYIMEMLLSNFVNEKGVSLSKNTMEDFITESTDRKTATRGRIDVPKILPKTNSVKKK